MVLGDMFRPQRRPNHKACDHASGCATMFFSVTFPATPGERREANCGAVVLLVGCEAWMWPSQPRACRGRFRQRLSHVQVAAVIQMDHNSKRKELTF